MREPKATIATILGVVGALVALELVGVGHHVEDPPVTSSNIVTFEAVRHGFDLDAEDFKSYEYFAETQTSNGWLATWSPFGGVNGGPFVTTHDFRWNIDFPEEPDSVLAYLHYSAHKPIDLRDGSIQLSVRGENFNSYGGSVQLWVHSEELATRWHLGTPVFVYNGLWSSQTIALVDDDRLWWQSWAATTPASLRNTLRTAASFGISVVNFSQEPSGSLSLDEVTLWVRQ